jgi:hypothetical protein
MAHMHTLTRHIGGGCLDFAHAPAMRTCMQLPSKRPRGPRMAERVHRRNEGELAASLPAPPLTPPTPAAQHQPSQPAVITKTLRAAADGPVKTEPIVEPLFKAHKPDLAAVAAAPDAPIVLTSRPKSTANPAKRRMASQPRPVSAVAR